MPRSKVEVWRSHLSIALGEGLGEGPNKAELRAMLSLLEDEGADPKKEYERAVLERRRYFPGSPPVPTYDELYMRDES